MIKEVHISKIGLNALQAVILWFSDPRRIAYHALSRIVRAIGQPLLQLIFGIIVKRLLGLNRECAAEDYTQMILIRRYVTSVLLGQDSLHRAFSILGAHYEIVSVSTFSG
jgi:hypothetical protein